MKKILDYAGLQKLVAKIKTGFMQKGEVEDGAEKNKVVSIKKNGTVLVPDANRSVDIVVPVKTSDLTNDTLFQTKAEVDAAISGAGNMQFVVVDELPATGQDNAIYLVPKTGGEGTNLKDEYMWINNAWERIGDTSMAVDLSAYLKTNDLVAITDTEIDAEFNK